uniref:Uncharacterized protein n=1 Tax=Ditylenchus dipsaci TaxID=166011 RepID=A0A915CR77_9BILA
MAMTAVDPQNVSEDRQKNRPEPKTTDPARNSMDLLFHSTISVAILAVVFACRIIFAVDFQGKKNQKKQVCDQQEQVDSLGCVLSESDLDEDWRSLPDDIPLHLHSYLKSPITRVSSLTFSSNFSDYSDAMTDQQPVSPDPSSNLSNYSSPEPAQQDDQEDSGRSKQSITTVGVQRDAAAEALAAAILKEQEEEEQWQDAPDPFMPRSDAQYSYFGGGGVVDAITEEDSDDLRSGQSSQASSQPSFANSSARTSSSVTAAAVEEEVDAHIEQVLQKSEASSPPQLPTSQPSSLNDQVEPAAPSVPKLVLLQEGEDSSETDTVLESTVEEVKEAKVKTKQDQAGVTMDADRDQFEVMVPVSDQFSTFPQVEDGRVSSTSMSINLDRSRDSLLDQSVYPSHFPYHHPGMPTIYSESRKRRAEQSEKASSTSSDEDEEALPPPPSAPIESNPTTISPAAALAIAESLVASIEELQPSPRELQQVPLESEESGIKYAVNGSGSNNIQPVRPISGSTERIASFVYGYGGATKAGEPLKSPLVWSSTRVGCVAGGGEETGKENTDTYRQEIGRVRKIYTSETEPKPKQKVEMAGKDGYETAVGGRPGSFANEMRSRLQQPFGQYAGNKSACKYLKDIAPPSPCCTISSCPTCSTSSSHTTVNKGSRGQRQTAALCTPTAVEVRNTTTKLYVLHPDGLPPTVGGSRLTVTPTTDQRNRLGCTNSAFFRYGSAAGQCPSSPPTLKDHFDGYRAETEYSRDDLISEGRRSRSTIREIPIQRSASAFAPSVFMSSSGAGGGGLGSGTSTGHYTSSGLAGGVGQYTSSTGAAGAGSGVHFGSGGGASGGHFTSSGGGGLTGGHYTSSGGGAAAGQFTSSGGAGGLVGGHYTSGAGGLGGAGGLYSTSSSHAQATTTALPLGSSSTSAYTTTKYQPATSGAPHEEYYRREVLTRTLVTRSTEALSGPPLSRSSPIERLPIDHLNVTRQLPEPSRGDEVSEEYWYKYSRNVEEEERRIRENQVKRRKEEEERRMKEEEKRRRWEQQELEQLERLRREREKMEKEFEYQVMERERAERDRVEKDRIEREAAEKQRRQEWERLERERRQYEESELEKRRQLERLEKERLERERLDRERLEMERLERERLKQEQMEKERIEREIIERERIEIERLEIERIERIKREQKEKEQREKERQREEAEKLERERLEAERLHRERIELERRERELIEIQRREAEQRDRERREDELREQRRRQQEQREREILEQVERETMEREMQRKLKEKAEQERLDNLRREQERLEFERLEVERRERQRQEEERREQELIEAQLRARDRREQERIEENRREAIRQEEERREQERRQRERIEAQERERLRLIEEQRERERVAALEAAAAERRAQRLEEERLQRNILELERRTEETKEIERREAEKREKERLEEERRLNELRDLERRNADQREAERRQAAEREANRRKEDRRSHDRLDLIVKERKRLRERWELERKRVIAEKEAEERKRHALTSKETLERLTRKPYYSRENLSTVGMPDVTTKVERQIIERVDRTLWTSDDLRYGGTQPSALYSGNGNPPLLDTSPNFMDDYLGSGAGQKERIYNPREEDFRRGGSTRTSKYKAKMEKARKEFLQSDTTGQYDPVSDRFRKSTEDLGRKVEYRGPLLQKFHSGEFSSSRAGDLDLAAPPQSYSRMGPSPYDQRHETNLDDVHRSKSVLDYDSQRQSRKDGADPDSAEQHSRSKSADYLLDRRIHGDVLAPENQLQKSITGDSHYPNDRREIYEHEERFRKSVEKLHVPDWYKERPTGLITSGPGYDFGPATTTTTATSGVFSGPVVMLLDLLMRYHLVHLFPSATLVEGPIISSHIQLNQPIQK